MSVTDDTHRSALVGAAAERTLAAVVITLAACMAAATLLGPLVFGVMEYRTSPTTLNQLRGSDAAALFAITPMTVFAAVLVLRHHLAGPPLATGVAVYALYTYAQVVIGQEYLRLPGNVERYFPLFLLIFVLAEAALVLAWQRFRREVPESSRRLQRLAGWVLLFVATFLALGQHLRPMLTAWQDPAALTEYVSSPTPFWMVKLMDLGIIVPVAVTTGVGLLRGARWAQRVVYPLITGYTFLLLSVTAMAAVMLLRDDPDASVPLLVGFGAFALFFVTLAVALYRPLFGGASTVHRRPPPGGQAS